MKKRILIIDDETSIQESLSGVLEDEGFSSLTTSTAEHGLELLEEENIDLILLDIWLGEGMDGMTALEKIKERSDIPVIMISASLRDERKAFDHGARFFFQKPCDLQVLLAALRTVIAEPLSLETCADPSETCVE